MRLVEAQINNLRSFSTTTSLAVEEHVTAILGKSESGKTNILHAIRKILTNEGYTPEDRCSWLTTPTPDTVMAWLTFELDAGDVNTLGIESTPSNSTRIRVGKRWDGLMAYDAGLPSRTELKLRPDIPRKLTNLRARARVLHRELGEIGRLHGISEPLLARLTALTESARLLREPATPQDIESSFTLAIGKLTSLRDSVRSDWNAAPDAEIYELVRRLSWLTNDVQRLQSTVNWDSIETQPIEESLLKSVLPVILYIGEGEEQVLGDAISITQLTISPNQFPLIVSLLELGGLTPSDLRVSDVTERNRGLDRASSLISERLSRMWKQEPVAVALRVEGDDFRVELKGSEGHYGRPGQRSRGFQWFVSFYLLINSLLPKDPTKSMLLLLDEPGLLLHAAAQVDLLNLFEDDSLKSVQILYTTHSPFLVNRNYPQRIRLVSKSGNHRGSAIDNKPYHSNRGFAWEPV